MSFNPQLTAVDGPADVPFTLQLNPGQDVRVFSVCAEWDGSGASGAFHPCLSLYSQDGVLVSRTRPEQTFAAGDSGVVTYAPFLHSEVPAVAGGNGPAFSVANSSGADNWDDLYLVDAAGGSSTQLTSNTNNGFDDGPNLSPDTLHVAWQRSTLTDDRHLWVIAADGSGALELVAATSFLPQWIDNDTILYQDSTQALLRIGRDGSGAATITAKAGIDAGSPSPDGTKVAYIAVTGGVTDLWVINADGTGDTKIVANIGAVSGFGGPVWRTDGSRIMYPKGSGMNTVNPDGTGDTVEVVTMPFGFWYPCGMHTDRFFFCNTATFTNWKLGQVVFGSGVSLVSPTLSMSRAVQRAVAVVFGGRVFTVQNGAIMPGNEDVVSILPDGSDYRIEFVPDESGAPLFQTPSFR